MKFRCLDKLFLLAFIFELLVLPQICFSYQSKQVKKEDILSSLLHSNYGSYKSIDDASLLGEKINTVSEALKKKRSNPDPDNKKKLKLKLMPRVDQMELEMIKSDYTKPIEFSDELQTKQISDYADKLLLNVSAHKYHGSIVFTLPNNSLLNESYSFNVINNYEIKGSNVSQIITDYRIKRNNTFITKEDLEMYKSKLENTMRPQLEKQITRELKDKLESKYLNYYMNNFTKLIEKNNKEELEIKKREIELENLKKFNIDQKNLLVQKEQKVNEMLKKLDALKVEFKKEKEANNELLKYINEKKLYIKDKELQLLDKIKEVKTELQILKDEKQKANNKKIEDLAINLKLIELKELSEKLDKEKKIINEEIEKNNKIYEENQKTLKLKNEEIELKEKAITEKEIKLKVLEKEAKHEILNRSLEYVIESGNSTDNLLNKVKKMDAKIMYDKLQIDLSIEEISRLKQKLEKEKSKSSEDFVKKQTDLDEREKILKEKEIEEAKLSEKEQKLREKLAATERELTIKESYLDDLEKRLLQLSNSMKNKTLCPDEIANNTDYDDSNDHSLDKFLDPKKAKSGMNKVDLLNSLNSNLIEEKLKVDAIYEVLKSKEKELNEKDEEMRKIEDHFLDLISYNGNQVFVNNTKLKEVYKKFSKVGKIKERIKKIFARLEKLRVLEEKLRKQKNELDKQEKELKEEIKSKKKYFTDEENKITVELNKVKEEIKHQEYLNIQLKGKEKDLQEKEKYLNIKLEEINRNNTEYNKKGYVNFTVYNDQYMKLLKEQAKLKEKKKLFEEEKEEFFDNLKELMKKLGNDTEKKKKLLSQKKHYEQKTKLLKEKEDELLKLKAKLKNLTKTDNNVKEDIEKAQNAIDELKKSNKEKEKKFKDFVEKEEMNINQERTKQEELLKELTKKEIYLKNKIRELDDKIKALKSQLDILREKEKVDSEKLNGITADDASEIKNLQDILDQLLADADELEKLLAKLKAKKKQLEDKDKELNEWDRQIKLKIDQYQLKNELRGLMDIGLHLPCVDMFKNKTVKNFFLSSRQICENIDIIYGDLALNFVYEDKKLENYYLSDDLRYYILVRFTSERTEIYIISIIGSRLHIHNKYYIRPSILGKGLGDDYDLEQIRRITLKKLILAYLYIPIIDNINKLPMKEDSNYTIAFTIKDGLYKGSTGEDDRIFQKALMKLDMYDSRFEKHLELKLINFRDIYEVAEPDEILSNYETYKSLLEPGNTLSWPDIEKIVQNYPHFSWSGQYIAGMTINEAVKKEFTNHTFSSSEEKEEKGETEENNKKKGKGEKKKEVKGEEEEKEDSGEKEEKEGKTNEEENVQTNNDNEDSQTAQEDNSEKVLKPKEDSSIEDLYVKATKAQSYSPQPKSKPDSKSDEDSAARKVSMAEEKSENHLNITTTKKRKLKQVFAQISSEVLDNNNSACFYSENRSNEYNSNNYNNCYKELKETYFNLKRTLTDEENIFKNRKYIQLNSNLKTAAKISFMLNKQASITSVEDFKHLIKKVCSMSPKKLSMNSNTCIDLTFTSIIVETSGNSFSDIYSDILKEFKEAQSSTENHGVDDNKNLKTLRKTFSQVYVDVTTSSLSENESQSTAYNLLTFVVAICILISTMLFEENIAKLSVPYFCKKETEPLDLLKMQTLFTKREIKMALFENEDGYLKLAYAGVVSSKWKSIEEALNNQDFRKAISSDKYLLNLYNQIAQRKFTLSIKKFIFIFEIMVLFFSLLCLNYILRTTYSQVSGYTLIKWVFRLSSITSVILLMYRGYTREEKDSEVDYLKLFSTFDESFYKNSIRIEPEASISN